MADVILALGGPYRYNGNSLSRNTVYDDQIDGGACRIADEYAHGIFTVGNSFNPMFSVGQAEALAKYGVKAGDFVGLFEIPEFHTLLDVATRVVPVQYNRGYTGPANSDGLSFTLVARIYDKETGQHSGDVELVSDMSGIAANTAGIKRSAVKPTEGGFFIEEGKYVILGLKVDTLPSTEHVTIADVTSRVEVTGHVFDYEAPIHV